MKLFLIWPVYHKHGVWTQVQRSPCIFLCKDHPHPYNIFFFRRCPRRRHTVSHGSSGLGDVTSSITVITDVHTYAIRRVVTPSRPARTNNPLRAPLQQRMYVVISASVQQQLCPIIHGFGKLICAVFSGGWCIAYVQCRPAERGVGPAMYGVCCSQNYVRTTDDIREFPQSAHAFAELWSRGCGWRVSYTRAGKRSNIGKKYIEWMFVWFLFDLLLSFVLATVPNSNCLADLCCGRRYAFTRFMSCSILFHQTAKIMD